MGARIPPAPPRSGVLESKQGGSVSISGGRERIRQRTRAVFSEMQDAVQQLACRCIGKLTALRALDRLVERSLPCMCEGRRQRDLVHFGDSLRMEQEQSA